MDTYNPCAPTEKDAGPWVLDPELLHCLIKEYYDKFLSADIVVVQKRTNKDNSEENSTHQK
jgi:hypothetical protein